MKYLCEGCERIVELTQFQMEGEALVAQCGKCGAVSRAARAAAAPARPAAAAAAPSRAVHAPVPAAASASANVYALRPAANPAEFTSVPPGFCPKCIAARPASATACPQCGLVYDNFQPSEVELSPELSAAWGALVPVWSDSARHDSFIGLALKHGELAAAGRLYRIRLVKDPNDALAQRGRDEVVRLALMPSFRAPDEEQQRIKARLQWVRGLQVVIFLALTAGCLFLVMRQMAAS